jgi:hypothetical protein
MDSLAAAFGVGYARAGAGGIRISIPSFDDALDGYFLFWKSD